MAARVTTNIPRKPQFFGRLSTEAKEEIKRLKEQKAQDTKEYRKKKPDALEVNDESKYKSEESDDDKGGHEGAEKAEGDEAGSHSQSSLQSGSPVAQFSSGGGVGGNASASLNSLMGLFSSSAALARAAAGFSLNLANQPNNLSLQYTLRGLANQTGSFFAEQDKELKGVAEVNSGQSSESVNAKFILETGSSLSSTLSNTLQNTALTLLKDISAAATQDLSNPDDTSYITIFATDTGGFTFYQSFNSSNYFAPPSDQFAFTVSSQNTTTGTLTPYSGQIGNYFTNAGLATSSEYTYQVLSPFVSTSSTIPPSSGISITNNGALNVTVTPVSDYSNPPGLTISPSGDIYVNPNIATPISVVVQATNAEGEKFTARIDAGPGGPVNQDNAPTSYYFSSDGSTVYVPIGTFTPNTMLGLADSNGQFSQKGTFFSSSGNDTIVGNGEAISVNPTGNVSYITGATFDYNTGVISTTTNNFNINPTGSVYDYDFPTSTIYRHVGTSDSTVPTEAAYGNFSSYTNPLYGYFYEEPNPTTYSTITLPQSPASDNLTFGGNVLDVYGSKYGVGDVLDVNLPSGQVPGTGVSNTITMGDNTLGGFGQSYGDLQTLTISAQQGNSLATLGPTDFVFRGNVLTVDKDIGSALYPHLQTLDMENASGSATPSSPANIQIDFQDSTIQGNTGSDTFYGDIQNLTTNTAGSYNGFIEGVTVQDVNGQVVTTSNDGLDNSITWGNDIYNGGSQLTTGVQSAPDTYNFTLLDDATTNKAVMQGNALLSNFNPITDKLVFQIYPSLFKALDGADGQGHDKQITLADLDASAKFTPFSFSTSASNASGDLSSANSLYKIDPTFVQYLLQTDPNQTITGTTITFDNGMGGSISLVGASIGNLTDLPASDVSVDLSYVYGSVEALPTAEIVPSTTPTTSPFLYGGPSSIYPDHSTIPAVTSPYYNELDNFFSHSLLATYTTNLPTSLGVTIDQYGTITSNNTTPVLQPITIVATTINPTTGEVDTAMTTQWFGFLDAPITVVGNGGTTVNLLNPNSISNIISGGQDSTLVGEPFPVLPVQASGTSYTSSGQVYDASNLITDTAGGGMAYGDFESVNLTAQGLNNTSLTAGTGSGSPTSSDVSGVINLQPFSFSTNAFYVLDGTTYGVAGVLDITVQGGSNNSLVSSSASMLSLDASAKFYGNAITFDPQTIYGSGTIYGDLQTLNITASAGSNPMIYDAAASGSGSLDVSAQVEGNVFTFQPTQITVEGDASGYTTTIYPNLQNIFVTVEGTVAKDIGSNYTTSSSGTFSGNSFVFQNDTVTGGQGNTVFNATPDLDANTYIAGTTAPSYNVYAYNGFINPVLVSINSTGNLVTTTTDSNNNSITWGNDTFTGGHGVNTYNFTVLEGETASQSSLLSAVFPGIDTITNFTVGTDIVTLNIAPTLYQQILQAVQQQFGYVPTSVGTLLDLGSMAMGTIATFTQSGGNTTITFGPGGSDQGSLTLDGVTVTNFTQLGSSLVVNELQTVSVAPIVNTSAVFDPVFVNVSQPEAFASFTPNVNPLDLTYSTTTQLPAGVSLSADGTLSFNVSGPVDTTLTVTAIEGTNTIILPPVHIFVNNAAAIDYDTTSATFSGTSNPGAYEVQAGVVYGVGLTDIDLSQSVSMSYGSQLIYDMSTVSHTIYGDTASITDNADVTITGQSTTFNANLMDINVGGGDVIYGNAQSLTIDAPITSGNAVSDNAFIFGSPVATGSSTLYGNTIYGTGSVYGDLQTLTLGGTATEHGSITSNVFTFASNALTSGVYVNGSGALTSSAAPTNLYASIGTLVLNPNDSVPMQVSGNTFIFGNSTLTAGGGPTNFYADIANLSTSDFVTTVTPGLSGGQLTTTDQSGNEITWGNDTFVGNASGGDSFNFTLMADSSNNPVMQGNALISNFNLTTDKLVLNLAAPLYEALSTSQVGTGPLAIEQVNRNASLATLTSELSGESTFTSTGSGTTINFPNGEGSLTFSGVNLTNFSSINNIQLNYDYFAAPITTNAAPTQPLIFNHGTTYYSVFDPYFNNVDISNAGSTYTVTSAIPGVSFPNSNPDLSFNSDGVPTASNTLTPILNLVDVSLNDVNFPTNHPSITALVGVFNGATVVDPGTGTMIGNPAGGVGELFLGQANDTLQGNAGNTTNQTTYEVVPTASDTATSTILYGGGNLFLDTAGGTTAYGDFQGINFVYDEANIPTYTELDISNQTLTLSSNAFDVNGTVYGVTSSFTITVAGYGNYADSNSTADLVGTVASHNTYYFGNQTIFGSGLIYGDLDTLTIALKGGSNDTESGTGSLAAQATFANNAFNFGTNLIDMIGTGANNTIYADVNDLVIQQQAGTNNVGNVNATAVASNNTFTFGDSILLGGQGTTDFYGHLSSFGNSDDPTLYGSNGFYDGVTVSTAFQNGKTVLTIQDGNGNTITWGNDTYTGGSEANTYNFTVVGTQTQNAPVMQGFDTITNFNTVTDSLVFNLAYPVYNQLAGGSPLTPTQFLNSLTISPFANGAELIFPGNGSLFLEWSGANPGTTIQSIINALSSRITVSLADPISAISNPVSNVMVFGSTTDLDTWGGLYNTGHALTASITGGNLNSSGITMSLTTNIDQSNVNFNGNTGIIDTTVTNVTASDLATSGVTSSGPVQILALDGTLIDQPTGNEQGNINGDTYGIYPDVFVGHGGATITGGTTTLNYTSTSDPGSSLTYASKLVYDASGQADTVYGDVQNIVMTNDGSSSGNTNTTGQALTIGSNFIEASGTIYGNVENLTMTVSSGAAQPNGNTITFENDTLVGGTGSDSFYGHLVSFGNSDNPNLYGSNGFYDGVAVNQTLLASGTVSITDGNGNTITWGNDTYTGGPGTNTYYFTIVGTNSGFSLPVGQGFDTITNFNLSTDELVFSVAYPVYAALIGSDALSGSALAASEFVGHGIQIQSHNGNTTLSFMGGGSIELEGIRSLSQSTLTTDITVTVADPISAILNPVSNVMVFGSTTDLDTWSNLFDTGHVLGGTIQGGSLNSSGVTITISNNLNQDNVNFNGNTGIIDTTVTNVTASDLATSEVTSSGPVQILALDGTLIDQTTNEQGTGANGINPDVFVGHGGITITGGVTTLDYTAAFSPTHAGTPLIYASKLIYDGSGQADIVYGDAQNIVMTNDGSSSGNTNTTGQALTTGNNFIEASGTIYGNVENLTMTASSGAAQPNGNTITFENDTLVGGAGSDSFYGHLSNFGNSDDPTLYGLNGFYNGVTVDQSLLTAATPMVKITDGNNNTITWGNNTYTGGTGVNTYNFTIVGTNAPTPLAVMQGFDTITNFNLSTDKLVFSESYDMYATGGYLASLNQTMTDAVLSFSGGGSIDLVGLGSSSYAYSTVLNSLNNDISVKVGDPAITAISSPTSNVMVFGSTTDLDTWSNLFNTGHALAATVTGGNLNSSGITMSVGSNIDQSTVNFNGNTGIISMTVTNVTANDLVTSSVISSGPVQILALDGTLIDQTTNEQGTGANGTDADVFVGHGGITITGGQTTLNYSSDPGTLTYASKLIYDGSGQADTVYGDVQNINISDLATNTTNQTLIVNSNFIETSGTIYGVASAFNVTSQGGSYNDPILVNQVVNDSSTVSGNKITFDSQTINGQGTLYGDLGSLSFNITAGSGDSADGSVIDNSAHVNGNQFTFGGNVIDVTGNVTSSLYAGIGSLQVMEQNGSGTTGLINSTLINNATFTNNTFTFGNTTETGGSGVTNFYGDINELSGTGFDSALAAANTLSGQVQAEDGAGNKINFGNDSMSAGSGQSTFNLDLLVTGGGNIVAEGDTTVNNFGAPGSANPNMLNLQLSTALYNDIVSYAAANHVALNTNSSGVSLITAGILDSYMSANHGSVSQSNGNTVITFSDSLGDSLGAITLTGVTTDASGHAITSLAQLGTNVEITGDGVTTIDPPGSPTTVYPVTIPGDTLSSYTQHTDIVDVSSLGQLVNFAGDVVINMSAAAFKAAGLSTTNTNAQNLQILEHDATTANGGIAVSTTTTGTGANAVTNTVLTVESTANGEVTTFGSITLHDTSPTNLYDIEFTDTASASTVQENATPVSNAMVQTNLNAPGTGTIDKTVFGNPVVQPRHTDTGAHYAPRFGHDGAHTNPAGTGTNIVTNTVASTATNTVLSAEPTANGAMTAYDSVTLHNAHFQGNGFTDTIGTAGTSANNVPTAQNNTTQPINDETHGHLADLGANSSPSVLTNAALSGEPTANGEVNTYGSVSPHNTSHDTHHSAYDIAFADATGTGIIGTGTSNTSAAPHHTPQPGHDVLHANSTGVNIFNINLLSSMNNNIAAEGNTAITNFGSPAASNLLNLHLSQSLTNDISQANGGTSTITPTMVDAYLATHNGTVDVVNGNTVISFHGSNGDNLGSVTLVGVQAHSLAAFGSDLAITSNGTMYIDSHNSTPTYTATSSGDSMASATQHVDIGHVAGIGAYTNSDGDVMLHMSSALFKALGLSDANTNAQNVAILEHGATTATGGIAESTTTTGTGANAVTNTVLTFESTVSGHVNTFGSLTLHDTHFNPLDPLHAHLTVTHH